MDRHHREHLHESPAVVWVPLVALAVPSLVAGALGIGPMLFGDYFGNSIVVAPAHDVLGELGSHWHGVWAFIVHGLAAPTTWLAFAGVFVAWLLYLKQPALPGRIAEAVRPLYRVLVAKYGFDAFNDWFFAGGARGTGGVLWRAGDVGLIDGLMVNGSARLVGWWAGVVKHVQSGYLYHYAFTMILGLLALLAVFVHRMFEL